MFVEELIKMVLESGLVHEAEDRYVLTGQLPPLAIPATLQDSLMARLDRLGWEVAVKRTATYFVYGMGKRRMSPGDAR